METTLKVIGKQDILFRWLDSEQTETTTTGGIVLQRTLNTSRNRWGKVIAVGEWSSAKVGEYICPDSHVEAWGASLNGGLRDSASDIWRIRDENVLCVTDDINDTMPINDDRKHTGVAETFHL